MVSRIPDRLQVPLTSAMRSVSTLGSASFRLADAAPAHRTSLPMPLAAPVLSALASPVQAKRREAVRQGRTVLAGLDRLRLARLGEGTLREAAEALGREAQDMTSGEDGALDDILDAIRLRAEVELAKLDQRG